jgi:hypothetical protein
MQKKKGEQRRERELLCEERVRLRAVYDRKMHELLSIRDDDNQSGGSEKERDALVAS